ncbi:hypothetical protein AC578_10072 [Pseudocercospora eumusae]|uniref:Arrestin-like N-terminal domain-containing protein n=1 Tax=Pseudocercospora eumusae TaxID=321146 RepID=A0A139H855_9PEZI|nr:hypothetical protein AC578_10072 [Pseudocercospora eumusae]
MGIFSRKEKIVPPQVAIHLDHAGPYAPGLPITGSVHVQTPVPRPISSVAITCVGKATTHNIRRVQRAGAGVGMASGPNTSTRRTIHYHDDAQLFREAQGLFSDTELIPEKPLTTQFSLTIPWGTEDVHGGGPYVEGRSNPEAYTTRSHPLPPTFVHQHDSDRYASIEYGLQVLIHFADGSSEPYASPVKGFVLIPLPNHSPSDARFLESIRPSEKYSSSRLTGAEKSAIHSFKDKFSSSTPSVNVVLKARTVSIVPTGSSFSIQTCAEIDSFSVDSISIPSVQLRIRDVKLMPITFYRALRVESLASSSLDRGEHEEIDEEKILLNANPDTQTVQGEQRMAENSSKLVFPATFEARIPSSVCPSFRTLNINRTYRLKMVLRADICGKEFEHKFELSVAVDTPAVR